MLFGRSLYGGALYPRQVTAAGAVACGASTSAKATAAFRDGSGTFATATVASGTGVRNVLPTPVVGQGAAAVSAKALAQFFLSVAPVATATVQGLARADFFGLGEAIGAAGPFGSIIRTIKVPTASNAKCFAEIEVEGAVYALADPEAALCYARPFGTHWYVGTGATAVSAAAVANGQIIRAASGTAQGTAQPLGNARCSLFSAGVLAGQASLACDPLITIDGVRYWDAQGESTARAAGHADEYIYAVALAVGFCNPRGSAQAHRAARGASAPVALGTGFMEIVLPEYGRVHIDSAAYADVSAHFFAFGSSRVAAEGASAAQAVISASAHVAVEAGSAATSGAVWSTAFGAANTESAAAGQSLRSVYASGDILLAPVPRGAARKAAAGTGQSIGLTQPTADGIYHPKVLCEGVVAAFAQLSAMYRLAQRAGGAAVVSALPVAANRVNDAGQRLSTRVVIVGGERRALSISEPLRLITVAGAARRLAA